MAEFEGEIRDRLGKIEGNLDLLVPAIQEIRNGLYGEVGLDTRLRKVEEGQASQKGFIAFAVLTGSFVGSLGTFVAQALWG